MLSEITSVNENVEKKEPLYAVGGNANLCKPLWKTITKTTKIELPYDLVILLLFTEKNENTNSKRYVHPYVYCDIIYKSQIMKAAQASADRWLDEEEDRWIYTMEYYPLNNELCHLQQHEWT